MWIIGHSERQGKNLSERHGIFPMESRIPGEVKMAGVRLLPKTAVKPQDRRYKKREGDK